MALIFIYGAMFFCHACKSVLLWRFSDTNIMIGQRVVKHRHWDFRHVTIQAVFGGFCFASNHVQFDFRLQGFFRGMACQAF
jgi:hypothetical protein